MKTSYRTNLIFLNIFSNFGSSVFVFILSLTILEQTKSAFDFSKILIFSSISAILSTPFIGVIVDKFDKKKLMIISQFFSIFILFLFIMYLDFFGKVGLISSIIVISILNVLDILFSTSLITSAKFIVNSENDLNNFNSLQQTILSLCSIIAPLTAGIIFSVVPLKIFLFIEVAMELCAVFFIYKLNYNVVSIPHELDNVNNSVNNSVFESLKYLLNNRHLIILIFGMFLINFVLSVINIGIPYLVINSFSGSSIFIGILEASIPLGMITIGVLLSFTTLYKNRIQNVAYLWSITGFSLILIGLFSYFISNNIIQFSIIVTIINFILGITLMLSRIPILTYFQLKIPDSKQGRIFSILDTVIQIAIPVSSGIFGMLFDILNSNIIFIATGIVIIFYSLISNIFIRKIL